MSGCPDNYLTYGQVSVWIIRVYDITRRGRIIQSLNYFAAYMQKASDVAEMVFSKILIKSLNLAENPYKIPKFGGKTNYIQKIGGDIISRNSTFFMYDGWVAAGPDCDKTNLFLTPIIVIF